MEPLRFLSVSLPPPSYDGGELTPCESGRVVLRRGDPLVGALLAERVPRGEATLTIVQGKLRIKSMHTQHTLARKPQSRAHTRVLAALLAH